MPPTAVDQYLVQLSLLTKMSPQEWQDFLSLTPPEQAIIAQGYVALDWRKDPDVFGKVMTILEAIGSIAGVVSGVAGAASAIAAMKDL